MIFETRFNQEEKVWQDSQRLDAPGTLHHVIGRGIGRVKIFRRDQDREDFISRLAKLCEAGALTVYAWALMDNHFHLLVRTRKQPLAKSMRKLLTGYVVNFNRRYRRYGHLFQNRYKSIVCEDDPYLLELTRYIHLNPLRAGIVESVGDLSNYAWTGHATLVGNLDRNWQDTSTILSYFGQRKNKAISEYVKFVGDGISYGRRPELVGGGLIRSVGGWGQVLSLRKKGMKTSFDNRILGRGEFVDELLSQADRRERETLRLRTEITGFRIIGVPGCQRGRDW